MPSKNPLVLNAGDLRTFGTIQYQGPTTPPTYDAAGPVLTWQTFAQAYCEVDPSDARDYLRRGQAISETEVPIRLWWISGVEANMRFVANGMTYIVKGIINVQERNIVLILRCIALGNNE